MFDTTIPTISSQGFTFEKIMLWSTCRSDGGRDGTANRLTQEEKEAIEFLQRCMDLDPTRRISAEEALLHPFLQVDEEEDDDEEGGGAPEAEMYDEEVMML